MIHAQIITHWVTGAMPDGTPVNAPALFAVDVTQTSADSLSDATGQPAQNIPTAPNLLVVECVVSDATFAAILAHPDYGPGAVLWSETL